MTPIKIIKLFGLKAVPFVMAAIGALALISLARDAEAFNPGALLTLLLARYDDFLSIVLGPFEPLLVDLLSPSWPGAALDPTPVWRHAFAVGALVAIGAAAPYYRRGAILTSILLGAVGLLAAAAAAMAVDQLGPGSGAAPLILAAALLALGLIALVAGARRAAREAAEGAPFFASWRDEEAGSNVGWTVLGALLTGGLLIGLDVSDYSAALAAWLWFI